MKTIATVFAILALTPCAHGSAIRCAESSAKDTLDISLETPVDGQNPLVVRERNDIINSDLSKPEVIAAKGIRSSLRIARQVERAVAKEIGKTLEQATGKAIEKMMIAVAEREKRLKDEQPGLIIGYIVNDRHGSVGNQHLAAVIGELSSAPGRTRLVDEVQHSLLERTGNLATAKDDVLSSVFGLQNPEQLQRIRNVLSVYHIDGPSLALMIEPISRDYIFRKRLPELSEKRKNLFRSIFSFSGDVASDTATSVTMMLAGGGILHYMGMPELGNAALYASPFLNSGFLSTVPAVLANFVVNTTYGMKKLLSSFDAKRALRGDVRGRTALVNDYVAFSARSIVDGTREFSAGEVEQKMKNAALELTEIKTWVQFFSTMEKFSEAQTIVSTTLANESLRPPHFIENADLILAAMVEGQKEGISYLLGEADIALVRQELEGMLTRQTRFTEFSRLLSQLDQSYSALPEVIAANKEIERHDRKSIERFFTDDLPLYRATTMSVRAGVELAAKTLRTRTETLARLLETDRLLRVSQLTRVALDPRAFSGVNP